LKITVTDVEHVALLSRLELSGPDKENYTRSLNAILEYMELLNRVDTSDVEPTAHVLPLKNVYREDEPKPCIDKIIALSNAPDQEKGCFRVPRII